MKILKYGSIVVVALLAIAIGFMSCTRGGKLERIAITPASPTIATGTTQQFTALAVFSNGTEIDWTTAAAWTSSDVQSVTTGSVFGTFGLATSLVTGTTGTFTITATDTANNISGTATLYVTDPQSIAITPAHPFMAVGTTHQFTATATLLLSDQTNTTTQNITSFATWTTTDSSIATVSSTGVVTTLATAGTTTIEAGIMTKLSGTVTESTTLTVTDTPLASLDVTAVVSSVTTSIPIISMATTTTLQFTATGNYPTGTPSTQPFTQSVTWSSSDTGVATIDASGLASAGTTTGSTAIRATDPITGISGTATLKVNQ